MIAYATVEVLDLGSEEVVTLSGDGEVLQTMHVDDPERLNEMLQEAGYEDIVWQPTLF